MSGHRRTEVGAELSEILVTGRLIRQEPRARIGYTFSHALFQEAAYNSMLRSFRRSVHARIGDALSEMLNSALVANGRERSEVLPSLAYHWSRAIDRKRPDVGRVEKAALALIQSAD